VLSRLLGWRYRGSGADHVRLVQQLPLIAFRPRKPDVSAGINAR
jgi:hypothetical protein